MPLTESDLPADWTKNYGAFVSFGEDLVMGTCKECFVSVNSDSFTAHTEYHTRGRVPGLIG